MSIIITWLDYSIQSQYLISECSSCFLFILSTAIYWSGDYWWPSRNTNWSAWKFNY